MWIKYLLYIFYNPFPFDTWFLISEVLSLSLSLSLSLVSKSSCPYFFVFMFSSSKYKMKVYHNKIPFLRLFLFYCRFMRNMLIARPQSVGHASVLIFRRWLYCCCFFWPHNYEYANCRNTGSLAGDLAETYFVLFMTKIESCIIWKGFSLCSNDKCFTEIQFYANN